MKRLKVLVHIIQVTGFSKFVLSFISFVFGQAFCSICWSPLLQTTVMASGMPL